MGKPVRNPLTGELYADGVVAAVAITSVRAKVLAGLPEPTRPGTSNNFDSAAASSGLQRQVRRQGRSADQLRDERVRPLQPPQGGQLRAAADPGPTSSPSNAYVDVLNQQVAGGVTRTLGLTSLLEVRVGISRTKAGKTALGTGTPNMSRPTASPACRPTRCSPAA